MSVRVCIVGYSDVSLATCYVDRWHEVVRRGRLIGEVKIRRNFVAFLSRCSSNDFAFR